MKKIEKLRLIVAGAIDQVCIDLVLQIALLVVRQQNIDSLGTILLLGNARVNSANDILGVKALIRLNLIKSNLDTLSAKRAAYLL